MDIVGLKKDGVSIKGYAFDKNNNYLEKDKLANLFLSIHEIDEFQKIIEELNGLFSIVLEKDSVLFLACDITRTFPLFYLKIDDKWVVSDDANLVRKNYNIKFNQKVLKDFNCAGYITGNQTCLENLNQVQAAEIIELKINAIRCKEYWTYATKNINKKSFQILQKELIDVYEKVAKRLINSAKGKTIVIPLSGGYDSRLVLALIKNYGSRNFVCYTYGVKNSFDAKVAINIAKKLNIRIEFIEYNNEFIDQQFEKNEFFNYVKFGSNYVSISHIQDFFAVKYLKSNRLVPEDSVFVPGHTGGFFAGSQLSWNIDQNSSEKKVKSEIIKNHFSLQLKCKNEINYYKKECFGFSNMDAWSWKERQSKFIVNSIRVYEFFGYKALLPLWDKELTNFFKTIPIKYKNRHFFISIL